MKHSMISILSELHETIRLRGRDVRVVHKSNKVTGHMCAGAGEWDRPLLLFEHHIFGKQLSCLFRELFAFPAGVAQGEYYERGRCSEHRKRCPPFRFVLLNAFQERRLEVHEFGRERLAALEATQESLSDLMVCARRAQLCDAVPGASALDHRSDEGFVFGDVPLIADGRRERETRGQKQWERRSKGCALTLMYGLRAFLPSGPTLDALLLRALDSGSAFALPLLPLPKTEFASSAGKWA